MSACSIRIVAHVISNDLIRFRDVRRIARRSCLYLDKRRNCSDVRWTLPARMLCAQSLKHSNRSLSASDMRGRQRRFAFSNVRNAFAFLRNRAVIVKPLWYF